MIESKVLVLVLGLFIFVAYPGYTEGKFHQELACEGHHLELNCSAGEVIKIVQAIYGRRNATACYPFEEPDPMYRPCQSVQARDVIDSFCEGKRNCSVEIKNSNFHDPCPGQIKYAEANFTCISITKH